MYNILILNKNDNTFQTICSVDSEESLLEISESLQNVLPDYLSVDFEILEE